MNCIYQIGACTFIIPNVERSEPDPEEIGVEMLEDCRQRVPINKSESNETNFLTEILES